MLKTRKIRVQITLDDKLKFSAGNTKIIEDLQMEVAIAKAGAPSRDSGTIDIYGMSLEDMGLLTTLNLKKKETLKNRVIVSAGYDSLSTVFNGDIVMSTVSMGEDNKISLECVNGFYDKMNVLQPVSIEGDVKASDIFQEIAKKMNLKYTNNGVESVVTDMILQGGGIDQANELAKAVDCEIFYDDTTMITSNRDKGLGSAVLINPSTGMIGFPEFDSKGIVVSCYFNPNIVYGGLIEVESIVPNASGIWKIYNIDYSLQNKGDDFQMTMRGAFYA